ncbi:MAG TPA: chloroperoxidase [Blastocatellia bacterium]|nr:chloroperoxidase [Blastocatellia bacterium]
MIREKFPRRNADSPSRRRYFFDRLKDKRLTVVAAVTAILLLSLIVPGHTQKQKQKQTSREFQETWGPSYSPQAGTPTPTVVDAPAGNDSMAMLHHWNHVAIDASGLDHTPVAPGENRVFGEQVGPCRAARAEAIVHIAIFEAVNAVAGGYQSYAGIERAPSNTSMNAAIAVAAHDTLSALFPSQAPAMHAQLAADLAAIPDGYSKSQGMKVGQRSAAKVLAMRANDGSQITEPRVGIDFITSNDAGKWRQDPISHHPLALGAYWGQVKPFVIVSAGQFRAPAPPALDSPEYAAAYNEAKQLGGDGITTPTARTAEQTEIGIYWAYDGTPSLCAPPRLYNQIAVKIADQMGSNIVQQARLLALVNAAMADAALAIWESKFYYEFWRPITAIREADAGTGPSGTGDGNPDTIGDVNFMPMGAPASNLTGPNFTPPFPSYPSGHGGFGGAVFQTLRRFYGTDNIPFTFVSDEFNGVTVDNGGNVRPLLPRSFAKLSQAEEENGQSRIYLGIHWAFDKTAAIAQGRQVGDWVFKRLFPPAPIRSK